MFSKSCKYAIRAVLYLAVHARPDHKIGIKPIAEALEVPMHFLGKILQQLAKHQIVSSTKGPGGGFFLTADNLANHIDKIITAIDGREVFTACVLGLPTCSPANPCPLHVQVFAYREGLRGQLHALTVAELAARIQRDHIRL
jgi:Rrf2 family transcriptional regulator, iron-sulfur cluster assembly transcription factor